MSYDDDNYATKQTMVLHLGTHLDNGLDEVVARVKWFNKIKLLNMQAIVVSIAYDDATCTLSLAKGATDFGYIPIADGAVGAVIDGSITAQIFETTDTLEIQLGHGTATGYCDVILQYQNLFV